MKKKPSQSATPPPRTKLTSMSLSDEIGNIKLKITRSPSEAAPRPVMAHDSDDEVIFDNYDVISTKTFQRKPFCLCKKIPLHESSDLEAI